MASNATFANDSFLPFSQLLYTHLRVPYEKSNCFFSPLSIYSGLSLALTGGSGQTHHAIAHALHVKTEHFKDYDSTLTHLGSELDKIPEGDADKTLVLANGLFLDGKFHVNDYFSRSLEKHFHAQPQLVEFSTDPEDARTKINNWVAQHTANKIQDLMPSDSINPQTRLVLANAIYFKGAWKYPFHRESTMMDTFHTLHDGDVQVPMMKDNGEYLTSEFPDLSVTAIKLPFKFHEMIVVLPHQQDGLPKLLEKLTDPKHYMYFKEIFEKSKYAEERIDLMLPKFKLGGGDSIDLKKPLSNMGLEVMFDQHKADFEKITTKEKLYVSDMVHKAVFEVNEEGAEAAAATGMAIMPMCMCPTIKVDHPFVFFIVTDTGFPAFMGHVVNPLAN